MKKKSYQSIRNKHTILVDCKYRFPINIRWLITAVKSNKFKQLILPKKCLLRTCLLSLTRFIHEFSFTHTLLVWICKWSHFHFDLPVQRSSYNMISIARRYREMKIFEIPHDCKVFSGWLTTRTTDENSKFKPTNIKFTSLRCHIRIITIYSIEY